MSAGGVRWCRLARCWAQWPSWRLCSAGGAVWGHAGGHCGLAGGPHQQSLEGPAEHGPSPLHPVPLVASHPQRTCRQTWLWAGWRGWPQSCRPAGRCRRPAAASARPSTSLQRTRGTRWLRQVVVGGGAACVPSRCKWPCAIRLAPGWLSHELQSETTERLQEPNPQKWGPPLCCNRGLRLIGLTATITTPTVSPSPPSPPLLLQASQLSDMLVELLLLSKDVRGARDAMAQCLAARTQVRGGRVGRGGAELAGAGRDP